MDSVIFLHAIVYTIIFLNMFTSYASHISYIDHCESMVPNSTPNKSKFKPFPLGQLHDGYIVGGGPMDQRKEQKHFTLQINDVFETDVDGILNVKARLIIQSATWYYRVPNNNFTDEAKIFITLSLDGFLSESSEMLCMVGTQTSEYYFSKLEVVLNLYNVVNSKSNTISSMVPASLKSLSSKHEVSYFEPISLFFLPRMDYEYTLDTEEAKDEYANEGELVPGLTVNPDRFCSKIFPMINDLYELQYHSECSSAKKCSPIVGDTNQLPYILSLNALVCSDDKKRVKVFIGFVNYDANYYLSFDPNASLVGEGWWDEEKNQLCIVGCHLLGMEGSMASVHVGDCSTRMILRFPKIWSINDASTIVGQIWSNKTFKRVIVRNHQDKRDRISGIKYAYTQLDKVRKMCPSQKPLKNRGIRYPNVYSSDMKFTMAVEYFGKTVSLADFFPFAVNDQIQKLNPNENFVSKSSHTKQFISANFTSAGLYNVSYQILFSLKSGITVGEKNSFITHFDINFSAEGIYDAEAGSLCMVGCRVLGSKNQIPTIDSVVDCEIIIKFQFQQRKANINGPYVKGSIESTRKNSDPLYFNPLNMISNAYYLARRVVEANSTRSSLHHQPLEHDFKCILYCTERY